MQSTKKEILEEFETRLVAVERCVSLDRSFAEFFELVLRASKSLGNVEHCTIWLYNQGVAERVISNGEGVAAPILPATLDDESRILFLDALDADEQSRHVQAFDEVSASFAICLETRFESPLSDTPLLREASLALAECVASWFRRSLIARIDEKLTTQKSATDFCHSVYPRLHASDSAFTLATEIRSLLNVDRVSLICVTPRGSEIAGISGTDRVDPTLAMPLAIRNMSNAIFGIDQTELNKWTSVSELKVLSPNLSAETTEVLSDGGTLLVRGIRIKCTALNSIHSEQEWWIVAELFGPESIPGESHWNICEGQIRRVLSTARAPRNTTLQKLKRLRKTSIAVVGIVFLACLGMIPIKFEVEAIGQMVPVTERKIFAPGSGNIQELSVTHESQVQVGQPLVKIHSAELALKIQDILGQLETERVRLSSLQRSRLSTNGGASTREGVEQAIGGEQAVRQRIASLDEQLKLLKAQQQRLQITAEFPGKVYRRNLELDLNARPVQQGDFLFDLIANNSEWRLELEIREDLLQYVCPVELRKSIDKRVRFNFVSQPEIRLNASIFRIDESVIQFNGRPCVVAYATVLEDSKLYADEHRKPGATVLARIDCGQRPAAFVICRELIEFIGEKYFCWF